MKIGSFDRNPAAERAAPASPERNANAVKSDGGGRGDASAKVALSSTATALASEGVGEPSFDQAKVDRIAQSIRDGSFKVNAEAIADKLMANAQDLLGKSGG